MQAYIINYLQLAPHGVSYRYHCSYLASPKKGVEGDFKKDSSAVHALL